MTLTQTEGFVTVYRYDRRGTVRSRSRWEGRHGFVRHLDDLADLACRFCLAQPGPGGVGR